MKEEFVSQEEDAMEESYKAGDDSNVKADEDEDVDMTAQPSTSVTATVTLAEAEANKDSLGGFNIILLLMSFYLCKELKS